MRFELFLAARYLKAKRRQAVVGVVTTISIAGVAAGVAALIIALAITNGMRRDLQDRLLGASAHVDLMRVEADGIRDWQPLLAKLRAVPHVVADAPGIYGQVLVSRGPRAGFALIKGIVPPRSGRSAACSTPSPPGRRANLIPRLRPGGYRQVKSMPPIRPWSWARISPSRLAPRWATACW